MAKREPLREILPAKVKKVSAVSLFYEEPLKDNSFMGVISVAGGYTKPKFRATTLKMLDDFYNGIFFKEKDIGLPYDVSTKKDTDEHSFVTTIRIAAAGYPKENISIQRFKNYIRLLMSSWGYEYSNSTMLKHNSIDISWRIPPHCTEVSASLKDGLLSVYICHDDDYLVDPPAQITIL